MHCLNSSFQFITHFRLTKIYNNNIIIFAKYSRKYLFTLFNILYQKNEFKHFFINDFFEYIIFCNIQYKNRFKININENFDKSFKKINVNIIKLNQNDSK